MTHFKFQSRSEIATALSVLLLEAIAKPKTTSAFCAISPTVPEKPDIIVPVPLHWTRHWKRGFNQATLLAHPVGQQLNIKVVHALSRRRRTQAQTLVKKTRRKRNLNNAFQIRTDVKGLHVALIDDVVTTGATASAAARVLLQNSASSVRVWACVRASNKHQSGR
ncbi:MAG: ComF family protein [Gammaproteobacteria bacterium]